LFDYQARALAWMMRREGEQQQHHREKEELHPLWIEFELPGGEHMYLNQLTSQVSVKPPMSKAQCLGGILADEMGLGKTVMMAALIVSAAEKKRESKKNEGKNLVVVPLTLLSQWESEIKRHTKNTKTLVYYGE
jgi:DNA repair protein RAD5